MGVFEVSPDSPEAVKQIETRLKELIGKCENVKTSEKQVISLISVTITFRNNSFGITFSATASDTRVTFTHLQRMGSSNTRSEKRTSAIGEIP